MSLVQMRTIPLASPSLPGTATGKTRIPLPLKYLHQAVHLENIGVGNFALADMAFINIYVNNKIRMQWVPTDLDKINQFMGMPAFSVDNILTIPFRRYKMVGSPDGTTQIQELVDSGINTGSYATDSNGGNIPGTSIEEFSIEIQWTGGASFATVTIKPSVEVTDALPGGAGTVPSVIYTTRSPNGAGVFQIQDLAYGNAQAALLDRIVMVPSTGTISELDLKVKTDYLQQRTAALHSRIQKNASKRTPQSGVYIYDYTEQGYGNTGLPIAGLTRNELSVEPTVSGAMTITIYEYVFGSL